VQGPHQHLVEVPGLRDLPHLREVPLEAAPHDLLAHPDPPALLRNCVFVAIVAGKVV